MEQGHRMIRRRAWGLAALFAASLEGTAHGQTVINAKDAHTLDTVVVSPRKSVTAALPINVAADSVERSQIEATNVITADDALRYVSNLQIRKRYLGDPNGAPAARGTSAPQAARNYVLLDGIPISNLLGSGFLHAPKWGLIAPDEIESIDVMYGPFSALYSGNTMGTGIFITTHMPERLEASVGVLGAFQNFHGYRTDLDLDAQRYDASLGNRHGNIAWSLYASHLDSEGNPVNFLTVPVSTGSSSLPGMPVTGAIRETDPGGIDRYVFGTSSTFSDRSDLVKGKFLWELDGDSKLFATLVYQNASSDLQHPQSYLRNELGQEVVSGRVQLGDRSFNLDGVSILQYSLTSTESLLAGVTFQKRLGSSWMIEASASSFDVLDGDIRTAVIAKSPTGQVNKILDQGWGNAALRAIATPAHWHWLGNTIVLGTDFGRYWNENAVYTSPRFWTGILGDEVERNRGRTQLASAFTENTWQFGQAFDLTVGMRYESWAASDGLRTLGSQSILYPTRKEDKWSPKLVFTWRPQADVSIQARGARAYRFPTVTELFQSRTTGGYLVQSDPNLAPEAATSFDLSATRYFKLGGGQGKISLAAFSEDVDDAIFNQYNVFQQATFNTSISRVVTRGVELNAAAFGLFNGVFDLDFNLARQRSEIKENKNNPATVGNDFPRIPDYRAKLLATWRPADKWTTSMGIAYEGKQYNLIDNSDDRSGGYGYMSQYTFVDLKTSYAISEQLTASLGIDNATDELAFYYHPYPRRTYSFSLRWRL